MNDSELDEVVKRLKKIHKIIAELDPAVRAPAFATLQPWVVNGLQAESGSVATPKKRAAKRAPAKSKSTTEDKSITVGDNSGLDRDAFFLKFNHDKPSDNALLVVAWHYNQYGLAPFSGDEIRKLGDEVGITVPERVDMTIANAQYDGKTCFARAGKSLFRPTVHGEARLKRTYGVKKGILSKQQSEERE
jgi:hypothetical protein